MGATSVVFAVAGVAMAMLALGYVLRPLWRTRPVAGFSAMAGFVLVTAMLYVAVGTPGALDPRAAKAPETLPDAIAQLEAELKRDPNQIEGWHLLARAYSAQSRLPEARDALARAVKLDPDNPDLLAEGAEMRALASPERRFDDESVAMLRHALQQQPMHQRARWFLGIAQRQAGQPAEAAKTWEPLLAVVEPATATSLRTQIDSARAEAGLPALPVAAAASAVSPASAPANAADSIRVKVALAPALLAKLPANATVFVIARQAGGPPMPVAVEKLPARGFPIEVTLDDGDSPMPTLKLSQLDQVEVLARVSASGDATPRTGDFEARAVAAAKGASVDVLIDSVRP